jgi:Protein of unknown function (DUF4242)
MREFVAEHYLPSTGAQAAVARAGAACEAAEQLTREGTPVEFVRSIFVPADETCIHLYRADTIESVRAAVARALLPLDRVAEATSWVPAAAIG